VSATEALPAPSRVADRFRPSTRGWAARLGVLVGIFGGILWITASVPGFWADRIALAVVYAIIGLSLNVILGYTGQVSLGHHAFIGIAAFTAANYVTKAGNCTTTEGCSLGAFGIATLLAVLSGAVASGVLGIVALRIKGLYLALITLAYGFVAETSIFEIPAFTGGGAGVAAPRPDGFTSDRAFAYLCFIFLAVVIFVDWRLLRSKVGRAIISIKNSEAVAASYGINVTSYKLLAFVISGMFAGLAGSLFAFRSTNVVVNDFTFATALLWVLMVVVGGLGNRVGVVIGGAFFALFPFLVELWSGLEHYVRDELARDPSHFSLVFGALLATLTIVQYQGGIAEQISPITRWLRGERFSMHPEGGGKHHHREPPLKSLKTRLGLDKAPAPTADDAPARSDGRSSVTAPDVWGNLVGSSSKRDDR
jgi:branched-chain amino acid transport system permease protein